MSEYNISIPGGETRRLLTGGKYCPENILVTAGLVDIPAEKDVNFYDYDGTLLYSYTLEEAMALTELPPLPEQETLTCLGWNWTLEEIKALPEDSVGAEIGALYDTEDGKTHCYFEVVHTCDNTVTLNFTETVNIDWGDGSVETNVTSPAVHTYNGVGLYVAKLDSETSYMVGNGTNAVVSEGKNLLKRFHLGTNGKLHSGGKGLYNMTCLEAATLAKKELYTSGMAFCYNLRHLNLGHTYAIGQQALQECTGLKTISLPYEAYINNQGLRNCYALKRVTYGFGSTSNHLEYATFQCRALQRACIGGSKIRNYAFYQTNSLQKVSIKEGIATIDAQAFQESGIPALKIPLSVTDIKTKAFYGCSNLKLLVFQSATPPVVENADAFTGIPASCIIEVPADSLTTYQEATNYSDIAAQMVGV